MRIFNNENIQPIQPITNTQIAENEHEIIESRSLDNVICANILPKYEIFMMQPGVQINISQSILYQHSMYILSL